MDPVVYPDEYVPLVSTSVLGAVAEPTVWPAVVAASPDPVAILNTRLEQQKLQMIRLQQQKALIDAEIATLEADTNETILELKNVVSPYYTPVITDDALPVVVDDLYY